VLSGAVVAHKSVFVGADCKISLCGSSCLKGFDAFKIFPWYLLHCVMFGLSSV